MGGIDARLLWRCAYEDCSFGEAIRFSIGVDSFSTEMDSMENSAGLKSSCDCGRVEPSVCTGGRKGGLEVFCDSSAEGCLNIDSGDTELGGSSAEESGERWSGLAMRRPPRDCERLKSPSMTGLG